MWVKMFLKFLGNIWLGFWMFLIFCFVPSCLEAIVVMHTTVSWVSSILMFSVSHIQATIGYSVLRRVHKLGLNKLEIESLSQHWTHITTLDFKDKVIWKIGVAETQFLYFEDIQFFYYYIFHL